MVAHPTLQSAPGSFQRKPTTKRSTKAKASATGRRKSAAGQSKAVAASSGRRRVAKKKPPLNKGRLKKLRGGLSFPTASR